MFQFNHRDFSPAAMVLLKEALKTYDGFYPSKEAEKLRTIREACKIPEICVTRGTGISIPKIILLEHGVLQWENLTEKERSVLTEFMETGHTCL